MKLISFNARMAEDAPADDEIEVMLLVIRHPSEAQPFRISSDNAVRIASTPIPRYASFSTWQSEDGQPQQFDFVAMGAVVPDETDEGPTDVPLVIENRELPGDEGKLIELITSDVRRDISVDLAVVLASDPDTVLYEALGMTVLAADWTADIIQFQLGPEPMLEEAWPADTITEARFPAIFAT